MTAVSTLPTPGAAALHVESHRWTGPGERQLPAAPEPTLVLVRCTALEVRIGSDAWTAAHSRSSTLVPPGCALSLRWTRNADVLRVTVPRHVLQSVAHAAPDAAGVASSIAPTAAADDPFAWHLAHALSETDAGPSRDRGAEVLAAHLLDAYPGPSVPATGGVTVSAVRRVESFVRERIDQALELSDLARLVGLSRFHFAREFKRSTGESPFGFVKRIRMEVAAVALRRTDHTVTQVAFDVGYASPSRFAAAFRQATGLSPSAYRRCIA